MFITNLFKDTLKLILGIALIVIFLMLPGILRFFVFGPIIHLTQ